MKIRLVGALLCGAAIALVATTGAFAQNKNNGIGDGKAGALGVRDKAATVKSSKSNTTDRSGGGGGARPAGKGDFTTGGATQRR